MAPNSVNIHTHNQIKNALKNSILTYGVFYLSIISPFKQNKRETEKQRERQRERDRERERENRKK